MAIGAALVATALFASVPARAATVPNFNGTVSLSNCSGAIVRWSTSIATDQAMMLTNGHCYRLMGGREAVVGVRAVRDVTLLKTNGSVAGTISTTRLLYATMWKTDVALYAFGLTYKQINNRYGVTAITLAKSKPSPNNEPISIVSGYWKTEYDCSLHGFAWKLHEDIYTWRNSLRYEDGGCEVIPGTSGSPVLNAQRLEIGINNTLNEDGERCTLNNPCEENRDGVTSVHQGRGYGQETWMFYTCLSGNTLNVSRSGCGLPRP